MKKLKLFIIYLICLLYHEFALRILILDNVFTFSNIHMILFLIGFSFLLTIFTRLLNEKTNKVFFFIYMILGLVIFGANYVLKTFFGFYLTFSALGLSDQVANGFVSDAIAQVIQRIVPLLILAVPLILGIIFRKKISFERINLKKGIVYLLLSILFFGMYYGSLYIGKNKEYSPYVLFHEVNNAEASIESTGTLNTLVLDIYKTLTGFEDKIIINNKPKEKEESEYEYNVLDIDFDGVINNSTDATIKSMSEYFKNDTGTLKNEYTGMFEGKNLILFMAESFSGVAVSKELTPTLYKLANEGGFVFNNFYTPSVYSTIGGEFQELTGIFPASLNILFQFREGTNKYPLGIGTLFKKSGYSNFAYHDSFSTFQDRNKYLKALGFDNFEGCDSDNNISCYPWPSSDVDMINATYEKYINSETPFMVFYATVSGHGGYSASSAYYKKYEDILYEKYPNAAVESKAYVAGQIELDRALERLLRILEENGKLDNTVIALVGDHAPYYLYETSMDYINDISTYVRDRDIELFHTNFILYNTEMEKVEVEKVGCQADVIPTLYNLFNLPYDSRLFIGKDLLSTEPGLAMLSGSWVTNEGYYIPSKGFKQTSENTLEEGYVDEINSLVKNKMSISNNLISKDYYKYLDIKIEETEAKVITGPKAEAKLIVNR